MALRRHRMLSATQYVTAFGPVQIQILNLGNTCMRNNLALRLENRELGLKLKSCSRDTEIIVLKLNLGYNS